MTPTDGGDRHTFAEEQRRKAEELAGILKGIRDRVRGQYPDGGVTEMWKVPAPDLTPLLRARDAAMAKVASIGSVNPRPGGPINSLVQFLKRCTARALDWHVREQVEFNRQVIRSMDAALEAMNEFNRALISASHEVQKANAALDARIEGQDQRVAALEGRIDARERQVADMVAHWAQWRPEWERKLLVNETQFLRSVADLQIASQHRATQMESNFRDIVKAQHVDYLGALDRSNEGMQTRFWAEIDKLRTEYERWIHEELRVFRQRAADLANARGPSAAKAPKMDYGWFAERFRGKESYVRQSAARYVDEFRGVDRVIDLGCGRGEFLEVMRDAGIPASGVELSEESVLHCRGKGLDAERADLFAYLENLLPGDLGGIFSSQVVEHLPPETLPRLVELAARALRPGGRIVIETPNPACLAIFATHFYLDPTHQRPVPSDLLAFYLQEFGFGRIRVDFLTPAEETMESLKELPEAFRNQFFGGLDYAISAVRL